MRRLIRNIQGERRPLIMHRRLQWLRAVDEWVRYRVRRALGLEYRRPRYLTPSVQSRAGDAETLDDRGLRG